MRSNLLHLNSNSCNHFYSKIPCNDLHCKRKKSGLINKIDSRQKALFCNPLHRKFANSSCVCIKAHDIDWGNLLGSLTIAVSGIYYNIKSDIDEKNFRKDIEILQKKGAEKTDTCNEKGDIHKSKSHQSHDKDKGVKSDNSH